MKKGFAQIISSGQYASIQDKGRFGFENYGVPPSGYLIRNEIISQAINAIEFIGTGLTLRFSDPVTLRFYGKGIGVKKNEEVFRDVFAISVKGGEILTIIENVGVSGYLFTELGWITERVMGSFSQSKGVTFYDRLLKGVTLSYFSDNSDVLILNKEKEGPTSDKDIIIKALPGPEFIKYGCMLTELQLTISPDTNRQAVCFKENAEGIFNEIKSSYTPVGTIQITKAGKVFILSRDGQTTGGYFRWGFISEKDLGLLCSFSPGTEVVVSMRSI